MRHACIVLSMTYRPELIGTAQAAKILKVSPRTIHRMVATGKLEPLGTLPGGIHESYIFDKPDVEALKQPE